MGFGGQSAAQVVSKINEMMVIGTYTGDGTADREISIGGKPKYGMILGENSDAVDHVWFVIEGAETKFTYPVIGGSANAAWAIASADSKQVKPSTNGFTLAAASTYDSNVNGKIYYYVMFLEVI